MEPLTSSKRLMILAAVLAVVAATAAILNYRQQITRTPFGDMLRNGLPMLNLSVVMRDKHNPDADDSEKNEDEANAGDEHCPTLSGGDTSSPTVVNQEDKRPPDCPRQAIWYVNKHPIAMTLYFNDGQKVLDWWDSEPQVQALRANRFTQGLFFGLLKSMKIKAEQLHLNGLQGEFLGQLLRDAIAANAELHYDMAHGQQGWVLSYPRGGGFSEQALPALAGLLADNGYRVNKLAEPIVELRIGLQHLFVTENQRRIYLAQSLEALLNVIESLDPDERHADAPLSLMVRSEAFVDQLLPILTGTPTAPIEFGFDLKDGHLGDLTLPPGHWQIPLHEHIFEGVLASIPHDAFAAVATSFRLPPTLTVADWRQFADNGPARTPPGPEPGGLALIWDFDGFSPRGVVGIAIANLDEPEANPAYRQYLRNAELADECAGGSVFLAASSQGLLARMKEACERQSLSALDWQRGADKPRLAKAQLLSFINPGTALRELFWAGGGGDSKEENDFAPRWQQEYEQAKAAMRADGDRLFRSLPIFSYAGRVGDQDRVTLAGKTINQEAAR